MSETPIYDALLLERTPIALAAERVDTASDFEDTLTRQQFLAELNRRGA